MKRFAFYGRVSTEDQQDPISSRNWQISRSKSLIEPHGGEIVAEFFDIGQSRSLPWKRRPEASALLQALADPLRGFSAVVIGEPARAFYGNQFGLTFPVFTHFGVELWVPEIGGRIEPDSDAHDLVMSLYGGMSKGERNRIKVRVRSAMAAQTRQEGRFLGGRPPYGYKIVDAGPHPNPGKASLGLRAHRLDVDLLTGPIVKRIFTEWNSGSGYYAIAEGLTRDGIPSPSAYDRARNRHRDGEGWAKSAIRAILANPRYTGYQVWNKQRRDEVLIDVEDVALGHESRMRWNDTDKWVWSEKPMHEPLVAMEEFETAQAHLAAKGKEKPMRHTRELKRGPYVLRGLLRCGLCDRKMHGSWNHNAARYRCQYPAQYAMANKIDHPKTIYVREAEIITALDGWISQAFDPDNIDATCGALQAAQADASDDALRCESIKTKLADCDKRLKKYRAALDADADPAIVAGWMAEVQKERRALEIELGQLTPQESLSQEQVKNLVQTISDMLTVLRTADAEDKMRLYNALGLDLRFDVPSQRVFVTADLGKHADSRVVKSVSAKGVQPSRHRSRLLGFTMVILDHFIRQGTLRRAQAQIVDTLQHPFALDPSLPAGSESSGVPVTRSRRRDSNE